VDFGLAWFLSEEMGLFNGKIGDLNQNGTVGNDDLDLFIDGWLTTEHDGLLNQYLHGNLNFDGITDIADIGLLRTGFELAGLAQPSLASLFDQGSVPEPSSCALAMITLLPALVRRRRATANHYRRLHGG